MSWQTGLLFICSLIGMIFGVDHEDRYFALGLALTANVCWAIDRLRRFT
jgi:hypothetical protein